MTTDDEAFVRRIVDSPGDDTPRLVYADWLDDRGDPRGTYLRAEWATVRNGDVEGLRDLASGLDPIWVARVSRPPVGVCCDELAFISGGPPVTWGLVQRKKTQLSMRFLPTYEAFLLNYNGGHIERVERTGSARSALPIRLATLDEIVTVQAVYREYDFEKLLIGYIQVDDMPCDILCLDADNPNFPEGLVSRERGQHEPLAPADHWNSFPKLMKALSDGFDLADPQRNWRPILS